MSTKGVKSAKSAKIASKGSKNNPAHRRKSDANAKKYNGKDVKPSRYIDDDSKVEYMCAVFKDTNAIVLDAYGNPAKWSDL